MPTPLTAAEFLAKYHALFADNQFENIREGTFRTFFDDLESTFALKRNITTNSIRGGLYRVPNLDALAAIPAEMRIVEMQAVALNGVSAAAALQGATAPAVYFQLRRNSAGLITALLDERPETIQTTKATWVQVSGEAQERVQSYPAFVLRPLYQRGDPLKYTFATGETRLFEARIQSTGPENPQPTGEENDPNYVPLAPLRGGTEAAAATIVLPAGANLAFNHVESTAEYPFLASGSFSVNVAGRRAGNVVSITLGAAAHLPALDGNIFILPPSAGSYVAGKEHRLMFQVMRDLRILYTITPLS